MTPQTNPPKTGPRVQSRGPPLRHPSPPSCRCVGHDLTRFGRAARIHRSYHLRVDTGNDCRKTEFPVTSPTSDPPAPDTGAAAAANEPTEAPAPTPGQHIPAIEPPPDLRESVTSTPPSDFPLEMLALPCDDSDEHRRLFDAWMSAYPDCTPAERGYIEQAVTASIEKRRLMRVRGTARTQKVRNGLLEYDRDRELEIAKCRLHFDVHAPSATMALRADAAGCRWLLNFMKGLATELATHGTLHEESSNGLLQALGYAACGDQPFTSVEAYAIVMDCLGATPNPRPSDVDRMLDPAYAPKGFLERGAVQWPRDPAECRARLQGILDREMHELRIREETFRLAYEQPERAEAPVMALAKPSRERHESDPRRADP